MAFGSVRTAFIYALMRLLSRLAADRRAVPPVAPNKNTADIAVFLFVFFTYICDVFCISVLACYDLGRYISTNLLTRDKVCVIM